MKIHFFPIVEDSFFSRKKRRKKQIKNFFSLLVIKHLTPKIHSFVCFTESFLTYENSPKTVQKTFTEKFWNICFDKGRLKMFIFWFLQNYGQKKTLEFLEKLKQIGFHSATQAGISLGIDDLLISPKKSMLMSFAEKGCQETFNQYKRGEITGVERFQRLIDTWHRTSEKFKQEVIDYFETTDLLNPVYMMAFSGARGNISQVRQLVGMRGLMSNPQGQILDYPIRSNFREGLTLTEYIISSYGARKGIVDTALRTANAGYLTRRLVDVAQHVIVSHFDCGTNRGIFVNEMKETGSKTLYSLQNRLIGRVLAADLEDSQKKIASKNQEISIDLAFEISKIHQRVFIRSPLTCEGKKLVCQLCYGWSLAEAKLVSIGEAVGIIAAQSIGEPGTQLTMRTFHTGGVFSGDVTEQVTATFSGEIEYKEGIPGKLIRTPEGKIAFLTKNEGCFILNQIKNKEFSSQFYDSEFFLKKKKKRNFKFFSIPAFTILYVRNKEKVSEGQILAQISSFSRQKKQRDDAEQKIYSEIEGEIYSKHIDVIAKTNSFEDNSIESWDWGAMWILSGKIYQSPVYSYFFPKSGDFINQNCVLNQIQWISPSNCEIIITSKKKLNNFHFCEKNTEQIENSSKKSKILYFFPKPNLEKQKKFIVFDKGNDNVHNTSLLEKPQLIQLKNYKKEEKRTGQFDFFKDLSLFSLKEKGCQKTSFHPFSIEKGKEPLIFSKRTDTDDKRKNNFHEKKTFKSLKKVEKDFEFFFKKPVLFFNLKKIDYQKFGYVFSFNSNKSNFSNKKQHFKKKIFSLICLNNNNEFFKSSLRSPSNWSKKSNFFLKCFSSKYQTNTGGFFYFNCLRNNEFSEFRKFDLIKTVPSKNEDFSFLNHLNGSVVHKKFSNLINRSKNFLELKKSFSNQLFSSIQCKSYFSEHILWVPNEFFALQNLKTTFENANSKKEFYLKQSRSCNFERVNVFSRPLFESNFSFLFSDLGYFKEKEHLSKCDQWFKKNQNEKSLSFFSLKKKLTIFRKEFFTQSANSSICLKFSKSHLIYFLSSNSPLFLKLNRQGIKTPIFSEFKGCLMLNIRRPLKSIQSSFLFKEKKHNKKRKTDFTISKGKQENNLFIKKIKKDQRFSKSFSNQFDFFKSFLCFSNNRKYRKSMELKNKLFKFTSENGFIKYQSVLKEDFYRNKNFFEIKNQSVFNNFSNLKAFPSDKLEFLNFFNVSNFLNKKKSNTQKLSRKQFSEKLRDIQKLEYKLQVKNGWFYFPKQISQAIQCHKIFIPPGKNFLDDLVFDKSHVFIECVSLDYEQKKEIFSSLKLRSFTWIFNKKSRYIQSNLDPLFQKKILTKFFSDKSQKSLKNLGSSALSNSVFFSKKLKKNQEKSVKQLSKSSLDTKCFFLFIQKAEDYFFRNIDSEKKEINKFSKKYKDEKFSYLLFKDHYLSLFNKQIISKKLDSLSPDFQIQSSSFLKFLSKEEKNRNLIKKQKKRPKKFFASFKQNKEKSKISLQSKLIDILTSKDLLFYKNQKYTRIEECFFSFKKINFLSFFLNFDNNDLFLEQKNFLDASVLNFSTTLFNFHSNEISFFEFFQLNNFLNFSIILSSLLLRSELLLKKSTFVYSENENNFFKKDLVFSEKMEFKFNLKNRKNSFSFKENLWEKELRFFFIKSLNVLSQYFFLPCIDISFQQPVIYFTNQFKKNTLFIKNKGNPFLGKGESFFAPVSEFFPISEYRFWLNSEQKIRVNTSFAQTSFYSPYKGEMAIRENFIQSKGTNENLKLILTPSDFISFYKNRDNDNLILDSDKRSLLFKEKEEDTKDNLLISYQKKVYKVNNLFLGFPKEKIVQSLGEFFVYGDFISKDVGITQSGQIVHCNNTKITLRKGQPLFVSPKAILHTSHRDFVNVGSTVLTLPYQRLKTGDIVQGIPKVEQFFEARTTKGGRFFRENLPNLLKGLFSRYQFKLPLHQAVRQSFYKIQQILIDGVQRVYRSQGVNISDKHIEIIVRQMTSKVKIVSGGQTGFFPGELVDLDFLEYVNVFLMRKVRYEPVLLGITKASLEVESFLSSASFQQTTKMLTRAAIYKRKDFLKGLKENVIVGNLIPVGTGYVSRNVI